MMNILEQEDMVKGLPDQVLIQQAQMPTGEIPQFLVVSELDRRQKMRKSFAERVPEETVAERVISGGIAAMNPNPDPLMTAAMGAQPPLPPPSPPMAGQPPQDPMMGQQIPPPVQMNTGGETLMSLNPRPPLRQRPTLTADELARIEALMVRNGLSREEAEAAIRFSPTGFSEYEVAESIYDYREPRVPGTGKLLPSGESKPELFKRIFGDRLELGKDDLAYATTDTSQGAGRTIGSWNFGSESPLPSGEERKRRFIEAALGSGALTDYVVSTPENDPFYSSKAQMSPVDRTFDIFSLAKKQEEIASTNTPAAVKADVKTGLEKNPQGLTDKNFIDSASAPSAGGENKFMLDGMNFTPGTLDLSQLESVMRADPIDYKNLGVNYEGLLAAEEARSKKAAEELRADAQANALIQLGAGIAAGNLPEAISKAGTAAMASKKEARAEEKGLSDLRRQIGLAERTQESALAIKGAEAERQRDIDLAKFSVDAQREVLKRDKDVYSAYIQMQTLLQKRAEAPTDEEREADLAYKNARTNYMNALADSNVMNSLYTDTALDQYIAQQLAKPDRIEELSFLRGQSKAEQRKWARQEMIQKGGIAPVGFSDNMAGGADSSIAGFNTIGLVSN